MTEQVNTNEATQESKQEYCCKQHEASCRILDLLGELELTTNEALDVLGASLMGIAKHAGIGAVIAGIDGYKLVAKADTDAKAESEKTPDEK